MWSRMVETFIKFSLSLQYLADLIQFGFQPLDFKVQFHAAIELLFLCRLGTQNGNVALEPGVGVQDRRAGPMRGRRNPAGQTCR